MPGDRRAEVHTGNDSRTRTLPWPPRGPSAATGFGRQWREEETEMYFALYSFKVNFAWLCAAAKFVPGSAFQCFSTMRGIRASLPLQLGKISALPYAEEGLWLVPLKTSSSSHKLVLCRKASAKPKHRLVASKRLRGSTEWLQSSNITEHWLQQGACNTEWTTKDL